MADLNAFENDREAVLDDLRHGEFDYVEVASRVHGADRHGEARRRPRRMRALRR